MQYKIYTFQTDTNFETLKFWKHIWGKSSLFRFDWVFNFLDLIEIGGTDGGNFVRSSSRPRPYADNCGEICISLLLQHVFLWFYNLYFSFFVTCISLILKLVFLFLKREFGGADGGNSVRSSAQAAARTAIQRWTKRSQRSQLPRLCTIPSSPQLGARLNLCTKSRGSNPKSKSKNDKFNDV